VYTWHTREARAGRIKEAEPGQTLPHSLMRSHKQFDGRGALPVPGETRPEEGAARYRRNRTAIGRSQGSGIDEKLNGMDVAGDSRREEKSSLEPGVDHEVDRLPVHLVRREKVSLHPQCTVSLKAPEHVN